MDQVLSRLGTGPEGTNVVIFSCNLLAPVNMDNVVKDVRCFGDEINSKNADLPYFPLNTSKLQERITRFSTEDNAERRMKHVVSHYKEHWKSCSVLCFQEVYDHKKLEEMVKEEGFLLIHEKRSHNSKGLETNDYGCIFVKDDQASGIRTIDTMKIIDSNKKRAVTAIDMPKFVLVNVHIATGCALPWKKKDDDTYQQGVFETIYTELSGKGKPVVVVGDFNLTPKDLQLACAGLYTLPEDMKRGPSMFMREGSHPHKYNEAVDHAMLLPTVGGTVRLQSVTTLAPLLPGGKGFLSAFYGSDEMFEKNLADPAYSTDHAAIKVVVSPH